MTTFGNILYESQQQRDNVLLITFIHNTSEYLLSAVVWLLNPPAQHRTGGDQLLLLPACWSPKVGDQTGAMAQLDSPRLFSNTTLQRKYILILNITKDDQHFLKPSIYCLVGIPRCG